MEKSRAAEAILDSDLPIPNSDFDSFCGELYAEGIAYDQLPADEVAKVGSHVGFLLHNLPDGTGRWISLHFREGMETLSQIGDKLARARAFISNLNEDLHLLAERLTGELRDVRMIYGLSQVSAKWGERHGFATRRFTPDPNLIERHCESITGLPRVANEPTLTLFAFDSEGFIRQFLKGSKPAPVPEPAPNAS